MSNKKATQPSDKPNKAAKSGLFVRLLDKLLSRVFAPKQQVMRFSSKDGGQRREKLAHADNEQQKPKV